MDDYAATIRDLSERLVAAQQPIRVLDAVAWDDTVRRDFFESGCARLPRVDRDYYARRRLGFEPAEVRATFEGIERDVEARLGAGDPAGRMLGRMCREYELVVAMLEARGTRDFPALSARLYGRAGEPLLPGQPSLVDLAQLLRDALDLIDASAFLDEQPRELSTEQAVALLQRKLDATLGPGSVHVRVDDGIVADAAAGSDYIKLRRGVKFSRREIDVLEAHEGWVHVGTTLNGRLQPVCTFLGKGTPATSVTQEGLAVFVEVTSMRSHPARLRRVTDRVHAVRMAEEGATFLDVFRDLCDDGLDREAAWRTSARVFRGGLPDAGPFSKDLSYSKGFVLIYNFLRLAVRRGLLDRIPLLFAGKLVLEEVWLLSDLLEQGVLEPPRFLPPGFADPSALVSWMAYSNFLNRIDLPALEASFAELLS